MNKSVKRILLFPFNVLYQFNPKITLKTLYFMKHKKVLNLDNPRKYNEKINWLKLYYRNDLMPICADKYLVRQYIKDCGYEDILNELLWVGFDANNIPFDDLPNQFVIKVTHGSGYNIICKDKKDLDIKKTIKTVNRWLNDRYLPCYGEWFYGVYKPRIIIEKFLTEDGVSVPKDYKLYYFNNVNGKREVAFTCVHTGRFANHRRTFYDLNWNVIKDLTISLPNDLNNIVPKPILYEKMIEIAKRLSEPFPHTRIDLYVVSNRIYFGEITFMNGSGFSIIKPNEYDTIIGNWIELPNK